jgi:hypothetical protein
VGTVQEEPDSLGFGKVLDINAIAWRWNFQRGHSPDHLAAHAKGLSSRSQDGDVGALAKDAVYKTGASLDHVLAVVDHQQNLSTA